MRAPLLLFFLRFANKPTVASCSHGKLTPRLCTARTKNAKMKNAGCWYGFLLTIEEFAGLVATRESLRDTSLVRQFSRRSGPGDDALTAAAKLIEKMSISPSTAVTSTAVTPALSEAVTLRFWVEDFMCARSIHVPRTAGGAFCLEDHKLLFGSMGIEQADSFEIFDRLTRSWHSILWSKSIYPGTENYYRDLEQQEEMREADVNLGRNECPIPYLRIMCLAVLELIENLNTDETTATVCLLSISIPNLASKPTIMKRSRTQNVIHFDDDDDNDNDSDCTSNSDDMEDKHDSFRLLFQDTGAKRLKTFVLPSPKKRNVLSQLPLVDDPLASEKPEVSEVIEESEDEKDSLADSDSETEYPQNPHRKQASDSFEASRRHSLSSKTAAYDYCKALQEHTNAAFPTTVENRYREFMTVMRVWRTLTALRRSGREHKMSTQIPDCRDHSIAIVCPACPEVGFNLDTETLENALLIETHKYTFYIMLDGNFQLQQKRKNTDLEDFALNKGHSYFVEEQAFREYLEKIGDLHNNNSTCAKLKAVRQQELIKFKNMIISGVIAVQCAHHGLYLPQGMVDLRKGESYSHADYALAHALGQESQKLRWIMLSYDIWCQYSKNLVSRMQNDSWPWMKEVAGRIRGAIPKMHIHGHKEQCQLNCSFMYTPFSGMTCGEGIESSWAEQNHAAGSTREQSGGHRHNTLDDFNNYWNWCKVQGLASYLLQQFKKYSKEHVELERHIEGFEQQMSPDLIEEWKIMESNPPESDGSKSRNDMLYRAKNIRLPTQESQSEKLISVARSSDVTIDITSKLVHFIEEGITIEKLQTSLQTSKTSMEPEALEDARFQLRKVIDIWRILQQKEQLYLPSSFDKERRQALDIGKIAEIEYQIRLGQAYDAIDSLRTAVYLYNSAKIQKRKHVRGNCYNTRANTILNQLSDDKYGCAQVYRLAYQALISLGLAEDSLLQPLHRDQLWGHDMTRMQGPGESSIPEPWWWMVGKPPDTCQEAWHIELDRVRWFRMRAALHRLREELEILNEEFKWTIRSFRNYCEIWKKIADLSTGRGPGYVAYGYCQAAMYGNLAASAQSAYSDALKYTLTGVLLNS
ncbi:hypothetical protein NP233_g9786 [Leucocoprinus birnbaumii]|uniref:CxC2-like cysteine cluster KDZ transposase-associated domain-containing protein n=1 Tax=Leucocoprinus birnbaumii TaxID=56174 RepID=A0AAD5VK71_9AGAR|nr:hypothetical protein NP233_g9786 [Leucocoprinus birnbaumii]